MNHLAVPTLDQNQHILPYNSSRRKSFYYEKHPRKLVEATDAPDAQISI
jgi:hypothetical protein